MNDDFKSQLTALVLDEVSADERAAIEGSLASAPEARAYAERTREFCHLLTDSLAVAGTASLTDEQREGLARRLGEAGTGESVVSIASRRGAWVGWAMGLGAAAAALVVGNYLWQDAGPRDLTLLTRSQADVELGGGGLSPAASDSQFDARTMDGLTRSKDDALLAMNDQAAGLAPPRDSRGALPALGVTLEAEPAGVADGDSVLLAQGGAQIKRVRLVEEVPKSSGESLVAEGLVEFGRDADQPLVRFGDETDGDGLATTGRTRGAIASARAAGPDTGTTSLDSSPGLPPTSGPAVAAAPAAAAAPADKSLDAAAAPGVLIAGLAPGAPDATAGETPDSAGVEKPPALAGEPLRQLADAKKEDESRHLSLRSELIAEQKDESRRRLSESEAWFAKDASFALVPATPGTEAYEEVPENPFLAVATVPRSTFSIDVDTAGYANVRRFLNQGQRPPRAAVRLEELVNYFRYDYPQPDGDAPFSVTVDLADCPWQPQHRLARIGLQGKSVARDQRPAANLVFLVDVSGSMDEPNKLPLVRQSLHLLTSQLKGSDHVSIVTYAGTSGVALPSTSLEQKATVTRAIDALVAGGSTNGASGIQLAYEQARHNFKPGGVNRVLLATDGDFNVGLTGRDDLERLITDEAKSGVFLTLLGYGMGNLKDATMEMLANKGNGHYAYIDSSSEARKVLAEQVEGTLMTIAKDVKIQIEFNPAHVRHYRLLGYENRLLAREDFNDDTKDAGEIGAGHSVTALYEIVPMSAPALTPPVDPLKYQPPPAAPAAPVVVDRPVSNESMTVKLRYKAPDGTTSQLIEVPVVDQERKIAEAPVDFKFAASVAMTGLLLKDSAHKGSADWNMVRGLARAGKGPDPEGYRGEFLQLVEKAAGVAP